MADITDLATEAEDMFLRQALEAQRKKAAGTRASAADWRVLSAVDCEGERCGEPIPEERRRAVPGVRLCVTCQQRKERQGK